MTLFVKANNIKLDINQLLKGKFIIMSQNISAVRMSELLLTRFTHDIAGPVSAVFNGLDFLMNDARYADDPGAIEIKNQAVDLVEESAKQSLARLQSYRLAYGVVYTDSAQTQVKEVIEIMKKYFHKSQVELRFGTSVPETVSAVKRRVLVGMILTISKILIYGGKISVTFTGEGRKNITVKSSSDKYKEPEIISDILMEKSEIEPDVDNVPYFFIRDTCKRHGIEINFKYGEENGSKFVEFVANFNE
jgi:hypothetical protein